MADSTWEERTKTLNEVGYARYEEHTSTALGVHTTELLLDRLGGDLRNLREEASRDPERERELLKEFKRTGDGGTDVYFCEVQIAWDESFPFAHWRALEGAKELGLEDNAEALAQLVGHRDFPKLVAALVRVQLEGDHDDVLKGARQLKE